MSEVIYRWYEYLYNASSFSFSSAIWSDRTSCSAQMCGSLRLRRACDRRGDKTRAAKLKHIYKLIHTHTNIRTLYHLRSQLSSVIVSIRNEMFQEIQAEELTCIPTISTYILYTITDYSMNYCTSKSIHIIIYCIPIPRE